MKFLVIMCVFAASVHFTEPFLHQILAIGPSGVVKPMAVDLNPLYQFMKYQRFLAGHRIQNLDKRYRLSLEAANDNVAMADKEVISKDGNKVQLSDRELSRTKRSVLEWPLQWSRFRKTE
ncbi:uncharacterized protein LOC123506603 isoform X1 [Portunus trituberculatus]|uniref:uncharacterized protein LOC123506603 isoform X1 n=1 Tax=Portunus trituberculatus TaxID=210409 RepID=UPI001E1CFA27|nr:uncharacterized protein LOC123506603 isoform X1 [Portunus trituberculatus]